MKVEYRITAHRLAAPLVTPIKPSKFVVDHAFLIEQREVTEWEPTEEFK